MYKRVFWESLMFGALVLWFLAIIIGFYLFSDNILLEWTPFIFLVLLHGTEVPIVLKKLNGSKKKPAVIAVKTFLFGFTWWLPFKNGIVKN